MWHLAPWRLPCRQPDELAALDPNSMAFRYGEEKYWGSNQFSAVPGETYVGVGHRQESVKDLMSALADTAGRLGPATRRGAVSSPTGQNRRHRRHSQFANSEFRLLMEFNPRDFLVASVRADQHRAIFVGQFGIALRAARQQDAHRCLFAPGSLAGICRKRLAGLTQRAAIGLRSMPPFRWVAASTDSKS